MTGSSATTFPVELLRRWVGRTETASETLTPAAAGRFLVTLDELDSEVPPFVDGDPAPTGMHWCIAPPALKSDALGPDGHPVLGGFLPPIENARRMWAGGQIECYRQMRIGTLVERRSTISSVDDKKGRSGDLCFVAVDHQYDDGSGPCVKERQTLVYRPVSQIASDDQKPAAPVSDWNEDGRHEIATTSTLLFRYSALTFNGHRIHYDLPYSTAVEGYDGLVVHGPLQATWMMRLAEARSGRPPARFRYRGRAPLICNRPASLGVDGDDGEMRLSVRDARTGSLTMDAVAAW